MFEIYNSINAACPSFMSEFFIPKDIQYDLRTNNLLQLPKTNSLAYRNSSLSFRGSILWNTLPDTIKAAQNTKQFKNMIKNGKGDVAVATSADDVYLDSCIYFTFIARFEHCIVNSWYLLVFFKTIAATNCK